MTSKEQVQLSERIAKGIIQFMRNFNWKPTLWDESELEDKASILAANSVLPELKWE